MLATIPSPHSGGIKQRHTVPVPALCPVTSNPAHGSRVIISYVGHDVLLDVVTLPEYISSFVGSHVIRDLEKFTTQIGVDVSLLVGTNVTVIGEFVLTDGQLLRCELTVSNLG